MKNVDKLHAVVVSTPGEGFTLAQTGDASLNQMITQVAKSDLEKAEIFGVPAALVVLVIVFGTLVAAGMPLVLSIVSIVLALALAGPDRPGLSDEHLRAEHPHDDGPRGRHRLHPVRDLALPRGTRARPAKIDAVAATGATANRAILFSGMTVVLAMLGMVIVPLDITISMGLGVVVFHRAGHHAHAPACPARRAGRQGRRPARADRRTRASRHRAPGTVRAPRPQHHAPQGSLAHGGRRRPARAGRAGLS